MQEKQLKHMDVRYHYVHECYENRHIELWYIQTEDNPADMFTKPLGWIKFEHCREKLGLVN